jgi:hypothetical protein
MPMPDEARVTIADLPARSDARRHPCGGGGKPNGVVMRVMVARFPGSLADSQSVTLPGNLRGTHGARPGEPCTVTNPAQHPGEVLRAGASGSPGDVGLPRLAAGVYRAVGGRSLRRSTV